MADIATLNELRALRTSIGSGDPVERDLATSVAVGQLLDDLIARREADAEMASRSGLLAECRVDVYRAGGEQRVVVTHLPTGAKADAPTLERALDGLPELLSAIGAPREVTGTVARPIDTSGMTGDGGKVSWPTA